MGMGLRTFDVVESGVESEADFGGADSHEFMLVGFGATELPDYVSKRVILGGTEVRDVGGNDVVDRKDVCHFDVQGWFGLGIEIIKFVNVK